MAKDSPSVQNHDHYRNVIDILPDGILETDPSGTIRLANQALHRLLGYEAGQLIGKKIWDLLSSIPEPEYSEIYPSRVTQRTSSSTYVTTVITRSGALIDVHVHWVCSRDASGQITGLILHITDITEAKKAQAELQKYADELQDLYQNAPCGYHSLNPRGLVIRINDTELNWLGYSREEVVGKMSLTDLVHPQYHDQFKSTFMILQERGWLRDIQYEMLRKDGTTFPALLSAVAVRDSGGHFVQSRAVVLDITKRKIAEEQSQRYSERLQALSHRLVKVQENERHSLAAELHDQVGQSLTALDINLNIIKGQLSPESVAKVGTWLDDSLKLIGATVDSIWNLMAELRPAVLNDYGLAAALRWYGEQFAMRTGVKTTVMGQEPVPRLAPAVEHTLFRIAQEALTNVAKYAGASQVMMTLETKSDSIRLIIADNGCGFEPIAFAQSKGHQGWGLVIMKERAEAVGGQLRVESETGKGTHILAEVRK
jgi:PAS domain S-box-containing protein